MNADISRQTRNKLFVLLLVCFAAAILGDATAEALLLARFGASFIPKMFLVNAAVLFLFSAGMLSIVDRIDRWNFIFRALLVHGGVLFLLRGAVAAHWDFIFLPLFSYAYSSKILFFLLFWTIANDLIDSRSASRDFPVIAAGGTIGAIAVSFSIPGLMRLFPVENLLVVWAGLAVAAGMLLFPLRKQYRAVSRRQSGISDTKTAVRPGFSLLLLLRDEPLLRSMSLLYFLVFFLLLNQHLVFYHHVKDAFKGAGAIAAFLGHFNGVSMLSTCILQVGVAGILLRKLGSTRSMLLLPSALLAVFLVLALVSGTFPGTGRMLFWTVIIGMGIRVAFFDAFFSPNFQLFFSSLPKQLRGRGKLLIEGVVKPVAMIVAGCWLLWGVTRLSTHVHMIIMVGIAIAALFQTILLKKAYTKTLTRYLTGISDGKRGMLLERFNFSGDEDILSFLVKQLDHEDFEVQKFLIEIIASVQTEDAASVLLEYMHHADPKLRASIIITLGGFSESLVADRLKSYLKDDDDRVVANAVAALAQCNAPDLRECIIPLIDHRNRRVRINAMLAIWNVSDSQEQDLYIRLLSKMVHGNIPEDCASAIYALGEIDDEWVMELLEAFCRKQMKHCFAAESVKQQVITALGKKKVDRSLVLLLQLSGACDGMQRKKIISALTNILPSIHENVWRYGIEKGNIVSRNCLLQALRKNRVAFSERTLRLLAQVAERELKAVEWEKKSLQVLTESRSSRMALLSFAIREELISIRIDTLVHMVVLLDRTRVIGPVIPRIYHTDPHIRARALEVLENNGEVKINRLVIEAIEWMERTFHTTNDTGQPARKDEVMVAGSYCVSHNTWVSTCAEYACAETVV
ncbi:MAG: HEAT repeat domain-containing protein [Chitinispirillaceae bacterium]|nr:HEAT repeat domain-containing protein [Chitinispirillaceae bacterium]